MIRNDFPSSVYPSTNSQNHLSFIIVHLHLTVPHTTSHNSKLISWPGLGQDNVCMWFLGSRTKNGEAMFPKKDPPWIEIDKHKLVHSNMKVFRRSMSHREGRRLVTSVLKRVVVIWDGDLILSSHIKYLLTSGIYLMLTVLSVLVCCVSSRIVVLRDSESVKATTVGT